MLVVTRREQEEIVIGDRTNPIGVVRVAKISGDRVRLGLTFPPEVEIHRRDVPGAHAGGVGSGGAALTKRPVRPVRAAALARIAAGEEPPQQHGERGVGRLLGDVIGGGA